MPQVEEAVAVLRVADREDPIGNLRTCLFFAEVGGFLSYVASVLQQSLQDLVEA